MNHATRIRVLTIALCWLLCQGSAWAQNGDDGGGTSKPPARRASAQLYIRVEPQTDRASAMLSVTSLRPLSVDNVAAEKQVRDALRLGFGGTADSTTRYDAGRYPEPRPDSGEDAEYIDEEEAEYTPRPVVADDWAIWNVSASRLGGADGGPVRRSGLLQSGRFDPAPLQKLLQTAGVPELKVTVVFQARNAPVARCANAAPASDEYPFARRKKNRAPSRYVATIPTATSYPELRFAAGYTSGDVAGRVFPALAVLLAAVVAFLWYRSQAVRAFDRADTLASTDPRAAERAREAIRFGFLRLITVGVPVLSALWGVAYFFLEPAAPLYWAANVQKLEPRMGGGILLYMLPISLVLLACTVLSLPVLRRADREGAAGITAAKLIREAGGQFALGTLPFLFGMLAVGAFLDAPVLRMIPLWIAMGRDNPAFFWNALLSSGAMRGVGWATLALIARPLIQQWTLATGEHAPVALSAGPLFDRVNELAKRAGVSVKHVVFLRTGSDRVANAFAAVGEILVFTDKLLSELSRREVDGVIAHELAHLKRKHPQRIGQMQTVLGWFPIGLLLYLGFTHKLPEDSRLIWALTIPGAALLTGAVTKAMSRAFEREADTDAATLTGDPGGLILGLARLGRLSGLPQDWGRLDAGLLTHPSTTRRIADLSDAGKLDAEARESLQSQFAGLDEPAPEAERYAAPDGGSDRQVFSPLAVLKNAILIGTGMLLVFALIPILFAHLAERFGVTVPPPPPGMSLEGLVMWREMRGGAPNWAILIALYTAGAAATYGALVAYTNAVATNFYRKREPQLRSHFLETGKLTPDEAASAIYIGIAPGTTPMNFGGSQAWDMGYLLLGDDGLRIVGEKTAFALRTRQIADLRLSPNQFPGLVTFSRVLLTGRDTNGNTASVMLAPGGMKTAFDLQRGSQELLDRLQRWRDAATGGGAAPDEPLLDWSDVSGLTPHAMARPAMLLPAVWQNIGTTVAAAILTGLPGRSVLACAVTVAAIMAIGWARLVLYREKA